MGRLQFLKMNFYLGLTLIFLYTLEICKSAPPQNAQTPKTQAQIIQDQNPLSRTKDKTKIPRFQNTPKQKKPKAESTILLKT